MRASAALVLALGALALAGAGRRARGPRPDEQPAAGAGGDVSEWMYFPDGEGEPRLAIMDPVPLDWFGYSRTSIEEDVLFLLFTRSNPDIGQRLLLNDTDQIRTTHFNPANPTRFIVHGWMSSAESTTVTNMRDAYLNTSEYNVVAVDWSFDASSRFYWFSKGSVPEVGRLLSELAVRLSALGARPQDMHLVGHSLGAHVVGAAGYHLAEHFTVARITGLDPAMPGFQYYENPEGRLDDSDAEFVQVIHTCSGALGYTSAIGHADFYPNGGTPLQPGCCCLPEAVQACSHARAHEYFTESIVTKVGFYAVECESWADFDSENCDNTTTVLMGEYVSTSSRGIYYLATNSSSPYALGKEEWMQDPGE